MRIILNLFSFFLVVGIRLFVCANFCDPRFRSVVCIAPWLVCANGGKCIVAKNNCASCICTSNWEGDHCKIPRSNTSGKMDQVTRSSSYMSTAQRQNPPVKRISLSDMVSRGPTTTNIGEDNNAMVKFLKDMNKSRTIGSGFTLDSIQVVKFNSSESLHMKEDMFGLGTLFSSQPSPDMSDCTHGINSFIGKATCSSQAMICRLLGKENSKSIGILRCKPGFALASGNCCHKCPLDCYNASCEKDSRSKDFRCVCSTGEFFKNLTGCVSKCSDENEHARCFHESAVISEKWNKSSRIFLIAPVCSLGFLLVFLLCYCRFKDFAPSFKYTTKDEKGQEFGEKSHDFFISYKGFSREEKWVEEELFPKLENSWNYKVFIHSRDFIAGQAITDNIENAIRNSRKTILILTPAYLKSEWCRHEMLLAYQEMLKRKTGIIPIVFEKIEKNNQQTLPFLKSTTYLKWEGGFEHNKDEFWRRLHEALQDNSVLELSKSMYNVFHKSHLFKNFIEPQVPRNSSLQTSRSPFFLPLPTIFHSEAFHGSVVKFVQTNFGLAPVKHEEPPLVFTRAASYIKGLDNINDALSSSTNPVALSFNEGKFDDNGESVLDTMSRIEKEQSLNSQSSLDSISVGSTEDKLNEDNKSDSAIRTEHFKYPALQKERMESDDSGIFDECSLTTQLYFHRNVVVI